MYVFCVQVFCGKIPKEIFEDELVPLFEKCGKIWDMRLMMDPYSGMNRGYAFVTYCDREAAQEAVKQVRRFSVHFALERLYISGVLDQRKELFTKLWHFY